MKRILYIEDDPIQRDVLTQMLTLYGFEVTLAENGLQGIEKATAELPDLILTDSHMPEMNGIEAVEIIRQTETIAATPIIALSARADRAYREQVLRAGVNAMFTKPVEIGRLVSTINHLLTET